MQPTERVSLDFDEFNTESCCDLVTLYDGDSGKAQLIAKLSGTYLKAPTGFNSTQRFMYIRFVSDDSITYRGFSASYTTATSGDPCSPETRPLELEDHGTFTSPNYPSYYSSNSDCQWMLIAGNESAVVVIHFTNFETESCCDKVNLFDGDSTKSKLIASLSGTNVTPQQKFRSTQPYLFVRFTSDDSITTLGFTASFNTE
jgi:hypothetical protein